MLKIVRLVSASLGPASSRGCSRLSGKGLRKGRVSWCSLTVEAAGSWQTLNCKFSGSGRFRRVQVSKVSHLCHRSRKKTPVQNPTPSLVCSTQVTLLPEISKASNR